MPMPTEHEIDLAIAALENQSASMTPAKAEFIRRYYRENHYEAYSRIRSLASAAIRGLVVCIGLGIVAFVLVLLFEISAQIARELVCNFLKCGI